MRRTADEPRSTHHFVCFKWHCGWELKNSLYWKSPCSPSATCHSYWSRCPLLVQWSMASLSCHPADNPLRLVGFQLLQQKDAPPRTCGGRWCLGFFMCCCQPQLRCGRSRRTSPMDCLSRGQGRWPNPGPSKSHRIGLKNLHFLFLAARQVVVSQWLQIISWPAIRAILAHASCSPVFRHRRNEKCWKIPSWALAKLKPPTMLVWKGFWKKLEAETISNRYEDIPNKIRYSYKCSNCTTSCKLT